MVALDGLVALAVTLALVYVLVAYTEWLFPWPMRLLHQLMRWTWRQLVEVGWRYPRRKLGVGMTVLIWLSVVAIAAAVTAILMGSQPAAVVAGLVWLAAAGWWYLLRWQAQRRYRVRQLPRRRAGGP